MDQCNEEIAYVSLEGKVTGGMLHLFRPVLRPDLPGVGTTERKEQELN